MQDVQLKKNNKQGIENNCSVEIFIRYILNSKHFLNVYY